MLRKPMVCVSVLFVINGIFLRNFKFLEACDGWHDLIEKATIFDDVAIVFVKGNYHYHRILFLYMCKDEDPDLLRNANLTEKCGIMWKSEIY